VMICVAINCSAYGCLGQFSIENFLSYGLEHENALQLFYHMNFVVQDATGMVFFLNFCFHVVVADHTSLLMCTQELLYMAYMLINYALFYISHL